MKLDLLKLMKCPYCNSELKLKDIYEKEEDNLIYGILKCNCNEFPILEGILDLKITTVNKKVIKFLKKGDKENALAISLLSSVEDISKATNILGTNFYGKIFKKLLLFILKRQINNNYHKYIEDIPFCDLRSDSWLEHRFSIQLIWANYPFIPILKQLNGTILDLGCWTGHLSYVIYNCVKPQRMVCIDNNFSSLYINKKHFVNDAELICFDLNYPLPFKNEIFTSVIFSNTFPYINSKSLLSYELGRVTSNRGFCQIMNLRNSLAKNYQSVNFDFPKLTPCEWSQFFKQNFETRVVPDKKIIEDFMEKDILDLSIEYSKKELNDSDPISIIASKDKSIFRIYKNIKNYFIENKDHLIINPIYEIDQREDKIILKKKDLGEDFLELYPLTNEYFPKKFILDRDILKSNNRNVIIENMSNEKIEYIEKLMKKFIIISVPPNYI